jgi:hypothetical protein
MNPKPKLISALITAIIFPAMVTIAITTTTTTSYSSILSSFSYIQPQTTAYAQEQGQGQQEQQEQTTSMLSGQFRGPDDGRHDAEGIAKEISLEDGRRYIRLENFKVTNGPDLFVYLATDKTSSDFVELGRLKANNGNQNYMIPQGTDLSKYDTVLIWCKTFSVLFGSAELSI